MSFVKVRTKSTEISMDVEAEEDFDCAGVTLSIILDKGEELVLNMWLIQEAVSYPKLRFDVKVETTDGRRLKADGGEIIFELEEAPSEQGQ